MKEEFESLDLTLHSQARSTFVRKVYSILTAQLLMTASFVFFNIYCPTFAEIQSQYLSLFILSVAATFIPLIMLVAVPSLSEKYPYNLILLFAFTLGESYSVSKICGMYTPESVLLAATTTAAATFGITFYALLSKSDFTAYSSNFYAFGSGFFWVMLQLALFNIFLFRISFLSNLIAFVIAIIYMGYILIDTQLILGGKNKELSLDNHILGSLILYIDIIVLFLRILQLLGSKKD